MKLKLKSREMTTKKLRYISFYTPDLQQVMETQKKHVSPYVDVYRAYNPDDMVSIGGTEFIRSFPDDHSMVLNPGLHKIGFGAYKPFLLLHELKSMQDGDVVIFRDVNVIKYPQYIDKLEEMRELANEILNDMEGADVFMPAEFGYNYTTLPLKWHCKGITIRELGNNEKYMYDVPLLIAHLIIVRKSTKSINLLTEWLEAVKNDRWISPIPNENPHCEFRWHTTEQSIFSIICAKKAREGLLPFDFPKYGMDRTFCKKSLRKISSKSP